MWRQFGRPRGDVAARDPVPAAVTRKHQASAQFHLAFSRRAQALLAENVPGVADRQSPVFELVPHVYFAVGVFVRLSRQNRPAPTLAVVLACRHPGLGEEDLTGRRQVEHRTTMRPPSTTMFGSASLLPGLSIKANGAVQLRPPSEESAPRCAASIWDRRFARTT